MTIYDFFSIFLITTGGVASVRWLKNVNRKYKHKRKQSSMVGQ